MLSVAQVKAEEEELSILFLCQKMQRLDLYGTVNTVFCTLDSLNHLTGEEDVRKTFSRVALFLEPNGYFIFDMNTLYKHQYILANQAYLYDTEDVFCAWQNHFEQKTGRVSITLDFFEKRGKLYERSSESFFERAYPLETILKWLEEAGMEPRLVLESGTFEAPSETTERVTIAARRI